MLAAPDVIFLLFGQNIIFYLVFLFKKKLYFLPVLADPGKARGCSTKTSVTQLYGAATPKRLKIALPV